MVARKHLCIIEIVSSGVPWGKPVFPFENGACAGVRAMALLDETRLVAERARRAKYRLHHVGTKLNEGELREFEALVISLI